MEACGIKTNPYNPCVENEIINGQHMNFNLYVDDLKVSHKDPLQTSKVSCYLSSIYRKKLKENGGKVHDYFGMDLNFSLKIPVKVSVIKHAKKIIEAFPEEIESTYKSPAANPLFQIREERKAMVLPEEQSVSFHNMVAHILFMSKRAKRYIGIFSHTFVEAQLMKGDK